MEKKAKKEKKTKEKGKGKGKLIIIILLLIVLGAGGFFGYRIFAAKNASKTPATTTEKAVSAYTFGLDEVLVNLSDEGTRYIKIQVYIGYDNKKLTTEVTENKAILRDMVISVLRTKSAADFSPEGVEKIKKELLSKINPLLSKGQATNIYFNDILVQ